MAEPPDTADRDMTEEVTLSTHTRDLDALGRGIANWLRETLGADGAVEVGNVHAPVGAGLSSITLLADAAWTVDGEPYQRKFAARLPPEDTSFPVFPSYDLRLQHDVMAAVRAGTDVPVPRVIGIEDTGDVIGTPFLVMDQVDGRLPLDNPPYVFCGWLYEATSGERRGLQDATLDVLARIHAIPGPGRLLPRLRPDGISPLRAHVNAANAYYEWIRRDDGLRIPLLERAFDWIEEHWPADPGEPVLNWGDARPGNVIYHGFTPRAVLDWEMAALGPREIDLGWYLFIHRFFQDIAEMAGLPGLPDMACRDEVVATYESLSGHRIRDLDWYLLYAALRHGIVMSQIRRRMIHFGEATVPDDVDDYILHRAAIERMLAGEYEWPAGSPGGRS
jgi:aminoglycoside phosphotransferase (APT) family kinase protein